MKLHVKSASLSTDNGQTSRFSIFYCPCVSNHKNYIPKHQDFPFFTVHVFLTIETTSQNISITLLQISLKLDEHQSLLEEKALVNDFGRTGPSAEIYCCTQNR